MSTLPASPRKISVWLMLILVLVTTWVRVWRLPEIPPAFNYDEAYNAIDSLWLWKSGTFVPYLPGNTGRHALFHYLAGLSLTVLGVNVFAMRLVSVFIGIVTVPLTYRWVTTMFAKMSTRHILGVIASAGMAFSFWHVLLSRSGFRASLLHFLYLLMAYLFWQGWQRRSTRYIVGAGIVLGLSQYTYWLAGLLPLQFGLFAFLLSTVARKTQPHRVKQIWRWIGVMAVGSFIVFVPLGASYLKDPTALGYVSQSSIAVKIAAGERSLGNHLLNSVRIFVDGPVGLWQGQTAQFMAFDWLALLGFWLGLLVALRRWQEPAYLFLLTGLLVLWLPAPLNDIDFSDLRLPAMLPVHHAISNLRVAGVLPIYYTLVAVGLLFGVQWAAQKLPAANKMSGVAAATAILVFVVSGGLNSYNFFVRWPAQPFLYERYNGPIFDLARQLAHESRSKDILIPFHLYAHPTMHFFFDSIFTETATPPLADSHKSAILVTTANHPESAYMWLVRTAEGAGAAFLVDTQNVAGLLQFSSQETMNTYNLAAPLMFSAQTTLIPNMESLRPKLANPPPTGKINYTWSNQVRLVGYKIMPEWTQPGQSINLSLYWRNLTDQPVTHDVFIHGVNSRGEGVGQVDGVELTDGHRWRAGKITPTHHTLHLAGGLSPGPYLIRLGLFNARTGNRVPISGNNEIIMGDEALIGPFYIVDTPQDPTQPQTPVQATLGQQLQVLGVTLPAQPIPHLGQETTISPKIYWQATRPVTDNYTIFVQLLSSQNQFVTGYDTQPLNGTYPTWRWPVGEVVAQQVDLTLPANIAPGTYRLVTGMYNYQTGQRLAAANGQGQPLAGNMVTLATVQILPEKIIFNAP